MHTYIELSDKCAKIVTPEITVISIERRKRGGVKIIVDGWMLAKLKRSQLKTLAAYLDDFSESGDFSE